MNVPRWIRTLMHNTLISDQRSRQIAIPIMPPPIRRDPYEQFDEGKAAYLRDNGYKPIDYFVVQELLDREPGLDTVVMKEYGWEFYRRIKGEIVPYTAKYLRENTFEELRLGAARMNKVSRSGRGE